MKSSPAIAIPEAFQQDPSELGARRLTLMKGRMTLNALQRKHIDDWKKLPKAERERAIQTLHLARQVEHDLGLDTETYAKTIRALEALAKDTANGG